MIDIQWTSKALSDLNRLFEFLAPKNREAAAKVVQSLTAAPEKLITQPRIGTALEGFEHREVRRLLIGHYEIRYEIHENTLYILRIWHTREQR